MQGVQRSYLMDLTAASQTPSLTDKCRSHVKLLPHRMLCGVVRNNSEVPEASLEQDM